mmetsp:Transcript_45235/g.107216  ORF Transcript_45235/g.107216 Transcript_45235/m.107216 type:complete len:549 (-) Transcript_45235:301-1947(-)
MAVRFLLLLAPLAVAGFQSQHAWLDQSLLSSRQQAAFVGSPFSPSLAARGAKLLSSSVPPQHGFQALPVITASKSRHMSRLHMSSEVLDEKAAKGGSESAGLGCWMPVASIEGLKDLNPHMVKIFNRNYAVWKNTHTGEWTVQTDACTHRLAPLSQGRVDEDTGCIECPYHGWQFNSSGACTVIPQGDVTAIQGDLAKVNTLPTHITGDLLWAFFPTSQTGESFPVDLLPEEQYPVLKSDTGVYFCREVPYSWDFLIENFMDPGHIPFAHHSLQGVRSDGCPIPMEVLTNNFTHVEVSFKDTIQGAPRDGVVSMQRPVYYHFRTRGQDGTMAERLKMFTVPVAHGRSRVFFTSPNVGGGLFPEWLIHAAGNRFLNTDTWLHDAERLFREGGREARYYNPTSSDLGASEFRRWWAKHSMAKAPPHSFGPAPLSDLPEQTRREQVDVWESHTKHCSACRKSARSFRSLHRFALAAGVLSVALFAASNTLLALALGSIGLLVSALADKCRRIIEGEVWPTGIADRSVSAQTPNKAQKKQSIQFSAQKSPPK